MTPNRFSHLLSMVCSYIKMNQSNSREAISPEERLAICLRYLATGDSQQSQSFNFRVGRATVCKIVKQVCLGIWEALHEQYLKVPATKQDWSCIADRFFSEWDFPHVLGAIDGKHIAMDCPRNAGSLYYNYKSFHSLVLLAICDAKYRFIYVDIGVFGGENDA